ncbi:MAG: FkbM family methyltransferase [Proteobacteria bacterium]|nr:FkbM family methyltransferase [Pseudomonadota bacterium]
MLESLLDVRQGVVFDPFAVDMPLEIVVFGTGERGRRCRERLVRLGVNVRCYADNDTKRQGTLLDGVPVLAPQTLAVQAAGLPVIVCSWAQERIVRQLWDLGVRGIYTDDYGVYPTRSLTENGEKVRAVYDSLADEESRAQYRGALQVRFRGVAMTYYADYPTYRHPLVKARPGDCIIDGGAASGDTLDLFLEDCGGDCAMHLFEPTQQSFQHLGATIAARGLAGAFPVNKALWDKNEELCFEEESPTGHSNHVCSTGEVRVEAVTLDSYVEAEGIARVDLIKLDIEGAELAALMGAAEVIRRHKPRLQICLYHKDQDLWDIPQYIKSLVPEYKMYVGHHSCCLLDTVLYCVM